MEEVKWWTTPRRIIQPVLRITDANIDGKKLVDEIYQIGGNTILLNTGCMAAWYPSKNPYHHTVQGMRGDIFGDVVERARKYGMKIMSRLDLSGLHRDAYEDHPEWFYVDRHGQPMINKGIFATCPSGPYYNDFFYPIFDEIWERYRIDGVFFNMFGYRDRDRGGVYRGPCHCDACKSAFEEMYKIPLPNEENWDDRNYFKYLEFREEMYKKTAFKVYKYIKNKSKNIGIFEGKRHRSPIKLIELNADVSAVETHWTLMKPHPSQTGQFISSAFLGGNVWRYISGETCRFVRTFNSGYATSVNMFQAGGGRFEAHSSGWMGMGISQVIANGGWPYIAFIGPPWLEDKKTKPVITKLYSFLAKQEAYFKGLISGAQVAIIQSENNLKPRFGRVDISEKSIFPYRGWYNVLVKAHIEFDVLDIKQILKNPNILDKYKLIILPNIALLSDETCSAIDKFVEFGGRLIATYETSMFDHQANKRDNYGLSCLGVDCSIAKREHLFNVYFRNDQSKYLPSLSETGLIYFSGGYIYPKVKLKVETALKLTGPIEYASPELEVIEAATDFPGLVCYSYGRGESVYFPWEIGRLIYKLGLEDHIKIVEDLINFLIPEGFNFYIDAPSWVEATLHKQHKKKQWIIQLVNESGQDGVEFREPVKVHGIKARLKIDNVRSIRSIWNNKSLNYKISKGWVEFSLPTLTLYDLVVVEY